MRARSRAACLLTAAILAFAGCAPFPTAQLAQGPGVAEAPYPALLPLDALLAGPPPRATAEARAGVDARVAALRARAARLQGTVIDAATRARMRRGVRLPG